MTQLKENPGNPVKILKIQDRLGRFELYVHHVKLVA